MEFNSLGCLFQRKTFQAAFHVFQREEARREGDHHGSSQSKAHCTAMVTVFEMAPPMAITTGIAAPIDDAAGTSASTWYSPTEPHPQNFILSRPLSR